MASLIKRGRVWWVKYSRGGKEARKSLRTRSIQIAKEKLRQFESARRQGQEDPFPTRTPPGEVLTRYVNHVRATKTPKSAQTDIYYLREAFSPICPALEITSRKIGPACRKRAILPDAQRDRRRRLKTIAAAWFEHIATSDIAEFIEEQVRSRGLAPKTANRYREILCRLFNWAMEQGGVRMPGDRNPAARVARYRERAPEIEFLTPPQIDEQLDALTDDPQLRIMVATYIYAGLRREEALYLTRADVSLRRGRNGLIHVRAKTVNDEFWEPKTKKNRAVPISRALRSYLERYEPRPSDGDWFFPSPEGKRWDPDNFSRHLRAANKKAGLRWACLVFRHTFGSQLAQKGVSLYKISELMGNSPEICRRHYAALIPAALTEDVEFAREKEGDDPGDLRIPGPSQAG